MFGIKEVQMMKKKTESTTFLMMFLDTRWPENVLTFKRCNRGLSLHFAMLLKGFNVFFPFPMNSGVPSHGIAPHIDRFCCTWRLRVQNYLIYTRRNTSNYRWVCMEIWRRGGLMNIHPCLFFINKPISHHHSTELMKLQPTSKFTSL